MQFSYSVEHALHSLFYIAGGQDNCRGSPWRRGSGYAAGLYMYYIIIIYITYIRMENID